MTRLKKVGDNNGFSVIVFYWRIRYGGFVKDLKDGFSRVYSMCDRNHGNQISVFDVRLVSRE